MSGTFTAFQIRVCKTVFYFHLELVYNRLLQEKNFKIFFQKQYRGRCLQIGGTGMILEKQGIV